MVYAGEDLLRNFFGFSSKASLLRKSEFWALRGVSFELRRGESLGLLGVNGCGKSTLLRLIAGLFPPDTGAIQVTGKVASMIAVGSGFHPHMTGRENIYLNASILGMSQDFVDKEFQNIVDFAEIGDFLDAPVATYSSGMRVRLGFAIASASEPDLLLLDEILSVGDRAFRVKCLNRIAKLQKNCAVIFVSHSIEQLRRVCNFGLYIKDSEVIGYGKITDMVDLYSSGISKQIESNSAGGSDYVGEGLQVFCKDKGKFKGIGFQECLSTEIVIKSVRSVSRAMLRLVVYNQDFLGIAEYRDKNFHSIVGGDNVIKVRTLPLSLRKGDYSVTLVVTGEYDTDCLIVCDRFLHIRSSGDLANLDFII